MIIQSGVLGRSSWQISWHPSPQPGINFYSHGYGLGTLLAMSSHLLIVKSLGKKEKKNQLLHFLNSNLTSLYHYQMNINDTEKWKLYKRKLEAGTRQVTEHPVTIYGTAEDFKYQTCPALTHSECVTGRGQACFVLNQD